MEWEELTRRLTDLKTVSQRNDYGQSLVDDLANVGLNARPGRLPDMEETKCVDEIGTSWIASNNFRVSLLGVDLLSEVVGHLGVKFRHLVTKVDNQLITKLGDPKVKDPSIQMFLNIFKAAFGGPDAQQLERILRQSWNDRVWRVREGGCQLLRHMLDRCCDDMFRGQAKEVGLSKLVPDLLRLADDDKQTEVREAAMDVFAAGYRCFGQRIQTDLYKRNPKRLNQIIDKMSDVIPETDIAIAPSSVGSATPTRSISRPGSRTGSRTPSNIRTPGSRVGSSGTLGRSKAGKPGTAGEGDRLSAGGVGVSELESEYESGLPDAAKIDMSERGIERLIENAKEKLTNPRTEWEHRVAELRLIRLVALEQILLQMSGAELRKLAPCLNFALADLRSAVTREACATIACMAKISANTSGESTYGSLAHLLIPSLIKLIPNSARIMSSSAVACLTIILRDCRHHKLIGHFAEQLRESKSVITRRKCIELIAHVLKLWPDSELRRAIDELSKSLQKTLQDADSEARQTARDGFHCLYDKFPAEAERIRSELPPQVQKRLQYAPLSRTGSQDSLASNGSQASSSSARTPSSRGRQRLISSGVRRPGSNTPTFKKTPGLERRARSDLDPSAFHNFAVSAANRNGYGVGKSAGTPKKFNVESRYSQKALGSRTPKKIVSQPGSRSGSPPHSLDSATTRRTPSRIPRSAASSRESSPDGYRPPDRRILPGGAIGARLVADILGVEQIVPSTAISRLTGATTNAERKEALAQLGRMADQNQQLTKLDLRRLADTIQKQITQAPDKTLTHVFDLVPKILKAYANEEPMKEWLYALLTGILKRLGQLLGAVRDKALIVLESIRDEYPKDLIYSRVTKFLIDQTQFPSTGQKSAILRFLRDLTQYLDSATIQNSSETRLVISKLVGWCNEPKNAEVRREAAKSIRSLFALNPAQFSAALQELPEPFQKGATKALKENSQDDSAETSSHHSLPHGSSSSHRPPSSSYQPRSYGAIPKFKSPNSHWSQPSHLRKAQSDLVSSDIANVSQQIQSLNFNAIDDDDETFMHNERIKPDPEEGSQFEQTMKEEFDALDDTVCNSGVLEPVDLLNRPNSSTKPNMLLEAIRLFQRKDGDQTQAAMKIVREAIRDLVDEHDDSKWNRIFPLLLEAAEDREARPELRVTALHCLRDISETRLAVATDNAELAIDKLLAIMSSDQDDRTMRDITRSSNNAALALLRNLSVWHSFTLLSTHVGRDFPVGRDAIDLCRSIIEEKSDIIKQAHIDTPDAQKSIHQLLTKLMEEWSSDQAGVRKSVVYCLVLFHITKAEVVGPYLAQASTTNRKLFDLYLKKHTSRPRT